MKNFLDGLMKMFVMIGMFIFLIFGTIIMFWPFIATILIFCVLFWIFLPVIGWILFSILTLAILLYIILNIFFN